MIDDHINSWHICKSYVNIVICLLSIALRYHPILETVQPANLWQTPSSFMSNVARPYPAQQGASSTSQITNPDAIYLANTYPNDVVDLSVSSATAAAAFSSSNNYYPSSDRTHPSPSSTSFPPLYTYLPASYNHHHHHHHSTLSSAVDDNSLLIQNPSLTWLFSVEKSTYIYTQTRIRAPLVQFYIVTSFNLLFILTFHFFSLHNH